MLTNAATDQSCEISDELCIQLYATFANNFRGYFFWEKHVNLIAGDVLVINDDLLATGDFPFSTLNQRVIMPEHFLIGEIESVERVNRLDDEKRYFYNKLEDAYYSEYDRTRTDTNFVVCGKTVALFDEHGIMEYIVCLR